jgi:hypothetical protein
MLQRTETTAMHISVIFRNKVNNLILREMNLLSQTIKQTIGVRKKQAHSCLECSHTFRYVCL